MQRTAETSTDFEKAFSASVLETDRLCSSASTVSGRSEAGEEAWTFDTP